MRARSAFFAGMGSAAIVAIGWQAGVGTLVSALPQSQASASGTTSNASSQTASTPPPSASADTGSSADSSATSSSQATPGAVDGTCDGAVIGTRYGNSQVQVVIAGGQISDVVVLQRQQDDRKSEQISARAVPMLREEVLAAQSAKVSNIGGATYTSQSYLQSLQSALDAAGFTG